MIEGDVNSEFHMTAEKISVRELKNLLRQFDKNFTNLQPTRDQTCLDNIFTNNKIPSESTVVKDFL